MKGIRFALITLGIILMLLVGIYLVYNLPLARHLPAVPPTPRLSPSPTTSLLLGWTQTPLVTITATSPTTTTMQTTMPAQTSGTCGETGVLKILLLGENLPETPGRGADAIRLMRLDYDGKRVGILALPPDLWVQSPDFASAGVDATTLTLLYDLGKQVTGGDEQNKMIGATNYFARALSENFAFQPTSYITLKQSVFRDLVDELGGLQISLPSAVDGTPEGFGRFSPGKQILSGQQAINYVRILLPAGDPAPSEWKRISRQNQVLVALNAQLTSPQVITKIPGVIQQSYKNIITDLSVKQLFSLACLLGSSGVSINLSELDPQLVTVGDEGVLLPRSDEVARFILEKVGP